jgi:hypothetical protein
MSGRLKPSPFKTFSGGSDKNHSFDAGPGLSQCCELCETAESRALPKCRDPSVRLSKHGRGRPCLHKLSLHFVALDHSVLNVDDAVSIGGDVIFVGD